MDLSAGWNPPGPKKFWNLNEILVLYHTKSVGVFLEH
jgi:hypothetical protein